VSDRRCVVFAYSEVGVRCLKALHSLGAEVELVVTHADDPNEQRWYGSVADTATELGIPVVMPESAGDPMLLARLRSIAPAFIFSFYYRNMIGAQLLATATRGALNIHGSLLPKFRGRAPVNWALVKGATQTGATLHYMIDKPDAGDIVGQQAVPILGEDTAREVFDKVVVAAEIVLCRAWPELVTGTAPRIVQDLQTGSYYGRRRPEDGRIDPRSSAKEIHDLVRAVAPPYPGAYFEMEGGPLFVYRTRLQSQIGTPRDRARLLRRAGAVLIECADGRDLLVLDGRVGGQSIDAWMAEQGIESLFIGG